ncbi:MAG: sodium-translocating pyrophosphatase [Phycisphaerales bacterium]|nr:sodium-translocating pyrophosphatase [Phycisphaerales bacterium]MCB9854252.1 sodium-translocating pyrophosphatase [Phycisphaerales bacterium]MCB9864740.1 sodium-translocating pyrophosphatase [Phycisphaerales bacterium]
MAFGDEAAGAGAAGTATSTAGGGWYWACWLFSVAAAAYALFRAWGFKEEVLQSDEGEPLMKEVAGYVRTGAMAYLKQQYYVVAVVFIVLMLLLAFMAFGLEVQHGIVPFAFLTGGFFSGFCGYCGMWIATRAAHRTTAGAKKSLNDGLRVAFRAGAVMGLVVVGFGLLDICLWFGVLRATSHMSLNEVTVIMLTFGMGASTQALFARVGGGIYTKAADVGADLVGKVEAGIPEDDPRNPAAIADNVGDNVGDVAGMGADLYESYCGSILATMALGVAAASALYSGDAAITAGFRLLFVPILLAGVGIFLSIWGISLVKTDEGASMSQIMKALGKGIVWSSIGIAVATYVVCFLVLRGMEGVSWAGIATSVVIGLFAGVGIGYFTERYTSYDYPPTQEIAEQAQTGAATLIIAGIAEGMKSTWASLTIIIVAILFAFIAAGGGNEFMLGLYGIGLAAVGMLATLGITLATDAYGPIADNAGGNAEMSGQPKEVRERTDALDAAGNTTAATGKGFAIGSAALTALALLAAYVEEVRVGQVREAKAYVEEFTHGSSKTDPKAGLGEVIYMGHGKCAQKWREGTAEGDYRSYMILNYHEMGEQVFGRGEDRVNPDTKLGALSGRSKEGAWVQTSMWKIGADQHTIELVASDKASLKQFMTFYDVTLMNPKVLCGMFAGVLLAFLFCALTMKAVGRAAYAMMLECRRQFEQMRKYLLSKGRTEAEAADCENWPRQQIDFEGSKLPDYANCVQISTRGAQKEMVFPSLLAIIIPVVVGLLFGVPGVMGLLAGGLTSGFAVAVFMANAGGAWDNAKKYIEVGHFGGKGSDAHKAGVVGDTVGDPFKDTSGPSLNILIKLMSMVSVVFAGLVVKYAPMISSALGLGG